MTAQEWTRGSFHSPIFLPHTPHPCRLTYACLCVQTCKALDTSCGTHSLLRQAERTKSLHLRGGCSSHNLHFNLGHMTSRGCTCVWWNKGCDLFIYCCCKLNYSLLVRTLDSCQRSDYRWLLQSPQHWWVVTGIAPPWEKSEQQT